MPLMDHNNPNDAIAPQRRKPATAEVDYELQEALYKSNTTAGALNEVLRLLDQRTAKLKDVQEKVQILAATISIAVMDAYDDEVIRTEMKDIIIGEGRQYATEDNWTYPKKKMVRGHVDLRDDVTGNMPDDIPVITASELNEVHEKVDALRDIVIRYMFISVLNGSNGYHYFICPECRGHNASEYGSNHNVLAITHTIDCSVWKALAESKEVIGNDE